MPGPTRPKEKAPPVAKQNNPGTFVKGYDPRRRVDHKATSMNFFQKELHAQLNEIDISTQRGMTNAALVVEKLIENAKNGDNAAIFYLVNRFLGAPTQKIEHEAQVNLDFSNLSREELVSLDAIFNRVTVVDIGVDNETT